MRLSQEALKRMIQEEVKKVREAPTSNMAEMVDRASAQIDMLLNDLLERFRDYEETYPEGALELFDDINELHDKINKLHDKYVKEEPVNTDAEEQRDREQNPERYLYDDD
jgi:uncharacterized membrane-anchored protein YhcB (DUF1043 family)